MSNVKKLVTIMLLVILMAIVLPYGVSKAETKATFSVTSAEGEVGDTVTVDLTLDNNINVMGYEIFIEFDPAKLENTSVVKGDSLKDAECMVKVVNDVDTNNRLGKVAVQLGNDEEFETKAGTLVTMSFRIKDGASGELPLTTTIKSIDDSTGHVISSYGAKNGNVTVKVPVKSISLNESTLNLTTNGSNTTGQLVATVTPNLSQVYPPETIKWSSTSPSIADVDQQGKVTAVHYGTTTIKAEVGGKSASCAVNVTTLLKGIKLDREAITLTKGKTDKLTYTFNPEDVYPKPTSVEWESDKPTVVSVNNGEITALDTKDGQQATITVRAGGYSATCVVTVKEIPLDHIEIDSADFDLDLGDSKTLGVLFKPSDTTDTLEKVVWSSDKPDIVKVDQNGKVTAVGVGVAVITAKANGKEATVTITVPEINITGVIIKAEKTKIKVDDTTKVTFTTNPEKVTDEITEVKYISEDEEIATVDENGVIIGVKPGKVKIKVIVNGKFTDEIEIEVVEKTAKLPEEEKDPENNKTEGSTSNKEDNKGESNTNTNNDNETKTENSNILDTILPKTGDIPIVLFVILIIVSLTGIVFVVSKKIKKTR